MNSKEALIDVFIDFVVHSSKSELNSFLEYLQKGGITKTPIGAILAVFIGGYLFGFGINNRGS
jgi:uncharacterized membrane protein YedE/YeeE